MYVKYGTLPILDSFNDQSSNDGTLPGREVKIIKIAGVRVRRLAGALYRIIVTKVQYAHLVQMTS